MQLVEECYNCILKRGQGILERNNSDIELQKQILHDIYTKNSLLNVSDSWLSLKCQKICPAQLGTNRQNILELHLLGNTYLEEKNIGHQIGRLIWDSFNNKKLSLESTLLYSLFGNGIEFDVGGNYNTITPKKTVNELQLILKSSTLQESAKQIALHIKTNLKKGDLVLFLMDNVGEHYFDALLIQGLLDSDFDVEIVVKGKPVLNDVTIFDMDKFPLQVKIWDTGNSDVGLFLNRIPEKLQNRMKEAKLLIIKGMAQFETLSSEKLPTDAIYMMKVKCNPVAQAVDAELGNFIFHYQSKSNSWF